MSKGFKEKVFEIAFGDNAINRDFSEEEVLKRLLYFSEKSWEVEEAEEHLLHLSLEEEDDE